MKKWILTVLIFIFVISIWQMWLIYHHTASYETKHAAVAVKKAEKKYDLKKVEDVSYYHGNDSFHVIEAVMDSGKSVYLWIPDKKDGHYYKRDIKDGLSKEKIIQKFKDMNYDYTKIIKTRLGIDEKEPVWEVTFLDTQGRYNYVYLYFDNGKEAERILHI